MAVREFLVAAAEHPGAVLLLDDIDLAPPDALILVDDVARLTRRHGLAVIIAQRSDARVRPGFEVVELADGPPAGQHATVDLPAELAEVLPRVAQIGDRFDRLEFTAATGRDPQAAGQLLDQALDCEAICVESGGYRFADPAIAARLAAQVTPALQPTVRTEIATRLADLGGPTWRMATSLPPRTGRTGVTDGQARTVSPRSIDHRRARSSSTGCKRIEKAPKDGGPDERHSVIG